MPELTEGDMPMIYIEFIPTTAFKNRPLLRLRVLNCFKKMSLLNQLPIIMGVNSAFKASKSSFDIISNSTKSLDSFNLAIACSLVRGALGLIKTNRIKKLLEEKAKIQLS